MKEARHWRLYIVISFIWMFRMDKSRGIKVDCGRQGWKKELMGSDYWWVWVFFWGWWKGNLANILKANELYSFKGWILCELYFNFKKDKIEVILDPTAQELPSSCQLGILQKATSVPLDTFSFILHICFVTLLSELGLLTSSPVFFPLILIGCACFYREFWVKRKYANLEYH